MIDPWKRGWLGSYGSAVALLALQATAALFFLLDGFDDAVMEAGHETRLTSVMELLVAAALLLGILLAGVNLRRIIDKDRQRDELLAMARGEFVAIARSRFADWNLSAAEQEVALFSLKGCTIQEIATMRGSANGTVRSQLSQIYAKANVNSQSMLAASFIEDLLSVDLIEEVRQRRT